MGVKPQYPVFVPSKGRSHVRMTAHYLTRDEVPFHLVVEKEEEQKYRAAFPYATVLVLPESGRGLVFARNWITTYARGLGVERHWQIDDNINGFLRYNLSSRIPCESGAALRVVEELADRYENVALAGMHYRKFIFPFGAKKSWEIQPFTVNAHVYSCTLFLNRIPYDWRGYWNEDVDMCLQVLSGGWCTICVNAFLQNKAATMTIKGGQTDTCYHGDGRLTMARELQRVWPNVVKVVRRFRRPQHYVDWTRFDTPLKLKDGIRLDELPRVNEFGMELREKKHVKSERLKGFLERQKRMKAEGGNDNACEVQGNLEAALENRGTDTGAC